MASHLPNLNHPSTNKRTSSKLLRRTCFHRAIAANHGGRHTAAVFNQRLMSASSSAVQLPDADDFFMARITGRATVQMYLKGEANWCRGGVFDRKPAKADNSSYYSSRSGTTPVSGPCMGQLAADRFPPAWPRS